MKEIEVKVKKYKCENCGKVHNITAAFRTCYLTGKELCTSCSIQLDDIVYYDNGMYKEHGVCVDKSLVKEYALEVYEDTYYNQVKKLEKEFLDKLKELNTQYITGTIEHNV